MDPDQCANQGKPASDSRRALGADPEGARGIALKGITSSLKGVENSKAAEGGTVDPVSDPIEPVPQSAIPSDTDEEQAPSVHESVDGTSHSSLRLDSFGSIDQADGNDQDGRPDAIDELLYILSNRIQIRLLTEIGTDEGTSLPGGAEVLTSDVPCDDSEPLLINDPEEHRLFNVESTPSTPEPRLDDHYENPDDSQMSTTDTTGTPTNNPGTRTKSGRFVRNH